MRWLTILALVALLGACTSSSSDDDTTPDETFEITEGTISGLAFTVLDGVVTQQEEDGPITAEEEAAIVFDDDLTVLSSTADQAIFQISATVLDGGFVSAFAFGDLADEFAETLIGALRRTGDAYEWAMFWGLAESPHASGSLVDPVDDPDGTVPLFAGFDNLDVPAYITIWDPDVAATGPFDQCGFETNDSVGMGGGGVVDNGNGDGAGINFGMSTISGVVIDAYTDVSGCF